MNFLLIPSMYILFLYIELACIHKELVKLSQYKLISNTTKQFYSVKK